MEEINSREEASETLAAQAGAEVKRKVEADKEAAEEIRLKGRWKIYQKQRKGTKINKVEGNAK